MKKAVHLFFSGKVQGVGFRFVAKKIADKYSLSGWIKNLSDRTVEALIQGEDLNIESCLKEIELYFKDNIKEVRSLEEAYIDLSDFQIRY